MLFWLGSLVARLSFTELAVTEAICAFLIMGSIWRWDIY